MDTCKVTIWLMVNPTRDAEKRKPETITSVHKVAAENQKRALELAEKEKDENIELKYLSVWDYKIEEV